MLFQLPAWCRPTPSGSSRLSSPDCGHLLRREGAATAACWAPAHHCCVFCPQTQRHWLVGWNESPSLICHWHTSHSPQYCFQKHLVSRIFCSVQVKATIQKLSGTWQCRNSWIYSFNIFVEVKGSWDRLLPTFNRSARKCVFSSITCSCGQVSFDFFKYLFWNNLTDKTKHQLRKWNICWSTVILLKKNVLPSV